MSIAGRTISSAPWATARSVLTVAWPALPGHASSEAYGRGKFLREEKIRDELNASTDAVAAGYDTEKLKAYLGPLVQDLVIRPGETSKTIPSSTTPDTLTGRDRYCRSKRARGDNVP